MQYYQGYGSDTLDTREIQVNTNTDTDTPGGISQKYTRQGPGVSRQQERTFLFIGEEKNNRGC